MAALTQEQVEQFRSDGYLLVRNLLDPAQDLDPLIAEYQSVLATLADDLYANAEIASPYAELPFSERLIQIVKESGKVHAQYFDMTLHGAAVTDETKFWVGPAVFDMLRNPHLLDAVESIIGPEIYSNPVQHVRLKPPERLTPKDAEGRTVLVSTPAHQDNGVVTPDADQTDMLTVWFPLWDVNVENGCLMVWPKQPSPGPSGPLPGLRRPAGAAQAAPAASLCRCPCSAATCCS